MGFEKKDGKWYTSKGQPVSEAFVNKCFKKGEAGNPNGRPKRKTISEQIRDLLQQEGKNGKTNLEELAEVIIKQAKKGRYPFIKEIFERMEGKVADKTQISGADGKPLFDVMDLSDGKRRDNFYELLRGSISSVDDGSVRPGSIRSNGEQN